MAFDNKDFEKRVTALIIHGFATAHAATAFALAQTMVGDEIVLTVLTIAMIECIARANDRKWGVAEALAVIGVMAGGYIGTRLGITLIKWIPGLGNGANAASTFVTTEILGWIAYAIVKQDKSPTELTETEKKTIKKAAEKLQEDKTGEKLYNRMSPADKEEFDKIIKQFKKLKKDDDAGRESLIQRLDAIAKKYG